MPLYKGQSLIAGEEGSGLLGGGCNIRYFDGTNSSDNIKMFSEAWKIRGLKATIFWTSYQEMTGFAVIDSTCAESSSKFTLKFTLQDLSNSIIGNTKTHMNKVYRVVTLTISSDGTAVTAINSSSGSVGAETYYLDTDTDYSVPYMPAYDGSPTSKAYVDRAIQSAIEDIPDSMFCWDGKSGEANPDNLVLWQKIVNKAAEETVLVYASSENDSSEIYKGVFVINQRMIDSMTSDSLTVYGFINDASITNDVSNGQLISFNRAQVNLTITNEVVTGVGNITYSSVSSARFLPTTGTAITSYSPTYNYHPATKKYVDDLVNTVDVREQLKNYLLKSGGKMDGALVFNGTNADALKLLWDGGAYQQRINVVDDSAANTNVFEFQQSTDSGKTFKTLASVKDNGHVVATSFDGNLSGNATSADKLKTARKISLTGQVSGSTTFNGSADKSISVSFNPEKIENNTDLNTIKTPGFYYAIGGNTSANKPKNVNCFSLEVKRSAQGLYSQVLIDSSHADRVSGRTLTRTYDSSRNEWSDWLECYSSENPQTTITGNAGSATKLANKRTINGTDFNGTSDITTANWGTARNIGIVSSDGTGTAVITSVNGSANVNLKLPSTIKATLTGNSDTASKLKTARTIGLSGDVTGSGSFDGSANLTINTTVANDSHSHTANTLPVVTDLNATTKTVKNSTTGWFTIAKTPVNNEFWSCRLLIESKSSATVWQTMIVDVAGFGNYSPIGRIIHRVNNGYYLNYLRVCYPKEASNGYGTLIEFNSNNATTKDIKVTLLESNNVKLTDIVASSYNSTYQNASNSSNLTGNGTYGWNTYNSGNTDSSAWTTSIQQYWFTTGETVVVNDLLGLGTDNKYYKLTNKSASFSTKNCNIMRCDGNYAINVTCYGRIVGGPFTPPVSYTTSNKGIVANKPVYVEGTISGDTFRSNGNITCVLTNGMSYMRIGVAKSTTQIILDMNVYCFTLDNQGGIENYNGYDLNGGHDILDKNGNKVEKRAKLQFLDCVVTDDATNDVTKIQPDLTGIWSQVNTNTGNILINMQNIQTNTEDIGTNKDDISKLKTRMTTAEGNITTNKNDISALKTKTNTTNTNVTNLTSRVKTNEDNIAALKTKTDKTNTNVSNLQSQVNTNATNISTNASDISALKTKTDTTNTNVANNTSRIDAILAGTAEIPSVADAEHAGNADKLGGQLPSYYATQGDLGNYLPLSGGTITGKTMILGSAASQSFWVRGIMGMTTDGTAADALYLNYGNSQPVYINGTNLVYHSGNIPKASTTVQGIVKLNNTRTSTSTSEAATANALKSAYDTVNSALTTHKNDTNVHLTDADRIVLTKANKFKGYYETETALNNAHPTGEVGDYAIVNTTDTVWIWDGDKEGGAGWKDAAGKGSVISVNNMTGEVVLTKSNLGLGNVDNTSDLNKPISTATQTALDKKVNKAGDTMTGKLTLAAAGLYSSSGNGGYFDQYMNLYPQANVASTDSWDIYNTSSTSILKLVWSTGAMTKSGTNEFRGATTISDATDSTSSATGALKISGGLGVAKAINSGTSITAGSSITAKTTVNAGTDLKTGSGIVNFNNKAKIQYNATDECIEFIFS